MYTWFDALLVTLLAIVTALGAQRGLIGLIWGAAAALICLLVNALFPNPALAALFALILSGAVAYVGIKLVPNPYAQPWFRVLGGVGGFLIGTVLLASLALSFPADSGRGARSVKYPAAEVPAPLHDAIKHSLLTERLGTLWNGNRFLQLLVVPDRSR